MLGGYQRGLKHSSVELQMVEIGAVEFGAVPKNWQLLKNSKTMGRILTLKQNGKIDKLQLEKEKKRYLELVNCSEKQRF